MKAKPPKLSFPPPPYQVIDEVPKCVFLKYISDLLAGAENAANAEKVEDQKKDSVLLRVHTFYKLIFITSGFSHQEPALFVPTAPLLV